MTSEVYLDQGLQRRIAKAQAYAANRPGVAGIVVRDRETGAVWRNANSQTHIWGCPSRNWPWWWICSCAMTRVGSG